MKVRLRDLLDEAIESGLRGFFNRVNKHSRYIKWERTRYVGNAFVYEKVPDGDVDRHIAEVVDNAMRRITESIDERFTFHDEEPIPICPHCGEPFKPNSDEQNSQG